MREHNDAEPLSIDWLTQGRATLPSVRFRVCPLFEAAREHGFAAGVQRYPKNGLQRMGFLAGLLTSKRTDVLIVQKRLLPAWELQLLRRCCSRLVYDFDDAVWTEQDSPSDPGSGSHWTRFQQTCRLADLVIAGNPYLASAVPPGTSVIILPTPIDTQHYLPVDPLLKYPDTPRIGWMGTSSYLPTIEQAVRKIKASTCLPVTVISNKTPDWNTDGLIEFRFWTPETELVELQDFDIGLMPLEDSAYTRGKGGFKLLQYMACGVVPIASAVGFNTEIIQHGVNGFLVEHPEQWGEYTSLLLAQPELRRKLAHAARETVCARFDVRPTADLLFSTLQLG